MHIDCHTPADEFAHTPTATIILVRFAFETATGYKDNGGVRGRPGNRSCFGSLSFRASGHAAGVDTSHKARLRAPLKTKNEASFFIFRAFRLGSQPLSDPRVLAKGLKTLGRPKVLGFGEVGRPAASEVFGQDLRQNVMQCCDSALDVRGF
jgi:hypothetical protein